MQKVVFLQIQIKSCLPLDSNLKEHNFFALLVLSTCSRRSGGSSGSFLRFRAGGLYAR